MRYTLITSTGKVMLFHVLAVAELYRTINGGVIVDKTLLDVGEFVSY
jgi:hypothetical protein